MRTTFGRWCAICAIITLILTNTLFAESSFVINIIDNHGDVGRFCSIAVDSNQNPVIAYRSETDDCVKFATIEDTDYQLEAVPATDSLGYGISLAVDNSGEFGIAHTDLYNLMFSLKTSWFDWHTVVADDEIYSSATALAFSENDVPHIAYVAAPASSNRLKHATYDRQTNSWVSQTVSIGDYDFPSIAVDSSDRIIIAFQSVGENLIHTVVNAGYGWTFLPTFEGFVPSMALDTAEQPAVAYIGYSGELYYATNTPIGWIHTVVDDGSEGPISYDAAPSLAFDNNGNPAIAYLRDGQLTYAAHHAGWLISPVDDSNADIAHLSLTFDHNNIPLIAFYDTSPSWDGTSLKLAGIDLTPTCVADLNNDGGVDFFNYALFANDWNTSGPETIADFDGSGYVDNTDLMVFCYYWLWHRAE